jgi:predicted nucleotidyltransferase
VRGEQKENSDLDILVDFQETADLLDMMGLDIFLERELQVKVDLVPQQAIRKELRQAIMKEAVRL